MMCFSLFPTLGAEECTYKGIKHALVKRTVDKSSSLFMIKYFANKKHFLGGHYIFARALFAVLSIIGIISEFSVASL